MRFFTTIVLSSLAVLGLATPAPQSSGTPAPQISGTPAPQSSGTNSANPFNVPTTGYNLKAGSPTTFTWTPTTSGTITLQLRSGASNALNQGTIIAKSIPNSGKFTYTPPEDTLNNSDYTIEIADDSNPSNVNFTPQFTISSTNTVSSASSSGSSTASATGSSSSASGSSSSASASSSSASASASSLSKSKSSSASSSAASSSAASSSASPSSASSTSAAAQTTTAPTSGAQAGLKVQGGLLAIIMGAAAAL